MCQDDLIIGICDDEPLIRKKIREVVERIQMENGLNFFVVEFSDGDEVLAFDKKIDLLILDIEMPGSNGFAVFHTLQMREEDTVIIYVTDHEEWMEDSFGPHVHGFVQKRLIGEKLERILLSVLGWLERPSVELADGIESKSVVYVKAETPYCRIHFRDKHDEMFRMGIDSMTEKLACADFIRVHRSYLVNLRWIEEITNQGVVVLGSLVPVSRRMRSEVRKAYMDYARKYAGYC